MIEQLEKLPEHVIGFNFKGKVSGTEYENVIFPIIRNATELDKHIHIICRFDATFENFDLKAWLDDTSVGLKHYRNWERVAIVSDHNWLNHTLQAMGLFIPGHLKVFSTDRYEQAVKWVAQDKYTTVLND